jgi:hypothetical protein
LNAIALAARGAPHDLDDFAHARQRTVEGEPVPAFDHLRPAHPHAEHEPAG